MLVGTKQSKQIPAAELDDKIKSLKEALAFEMGMRDKKYETTLERISV